MVMALEKVSTLNPVLFDAVLPQTQPLDNYEVATGKQVVVIGLFLHIGMFPLMLFRVFILQS